MVDTGNPKPAPGPVEQPHKPPPKLDDVLPLSLKIAGWTIPLVIGVIGLVKTVSDMNIAAQREVRERAAAEIAFFDKQYDYATRYALEAGKQDLAIASLDAMLERTQPDLSAGPLFDWMLRDQQDRAMRQVCAARRTALSLYRKGAQPPVVSYFQDRWGRLDAAAERNPASPAAGVIAYDRRCAGLSADVAAPAEKVAAAPTPATSTGTPATPAATTPPAPPPPIAKVEPPPSKTINPTTPAVAPPVVIARPTVPARTLDCASVPRASAGPNAAATVATAEKAASGWRLDIFWCAKADAAQEAAQFATACRAYNTLAARSTVGQSKPLGRLRLRRLPLELQSGRGYPSNGTIVRYDADDLEEQLLAEDIGQTVWPGAFQTQGAYTGTRWYMSMFSCGR